MKQEPATPTIPSPPAKVSAILERVREKLNAGGHLALMLDYDGTLTPIVSRPEDAQIDAEGLKRLKFLADHPQVSLALISGRSVEQIRGFVSSIFPCPMLIAGLHGGQVWEAQEGNWLQEPAPALVDMKEAFANKLEAALIKLSGKDDLPEGIYIEEKGYTFALHFRNANEAMGHKAQKTLETLYDEDLQIQLSFRLQYGHKVLEIVPIHFNKGAGVAFCLEYWPYRAGSEQLFPIFAGDDKTDEPGLQAAIDKGGIGIAVGVEPDEMQGIRGEDRARVMALNDSREVHQLLEGIIRLL